MRLPLSTAKSNASPMSSGIPAPKLPNCSHEWNSSCASGAIPTIAPLLSVPSPRTEPATCVPWPLSSSAPSSHDAPGTPGAVYVQNVFGHDKMPLMWSAKSGCIPELFTPLSIPLSPTVTMIPLPSNAFQDESAFDIFVLSCVSSECMIVPATVLTAV